MGTQDYCHQFNVWSNVKYGHKLIFCPQVVVLNDGHKSIFACLYEYHRCHNKVFKREAQKQNQSI